jgi:hypothetical protein
LREEKREGKKEEGGSIYALSLTQREELTIVVSDIVDDNS